LGFGQSHQHGEPPIECGGPVHGQAAQAERHVRYYSKRWLEEKSSEAPPTTFAGRITVQDQTRSPIDQFATPSET
jgi:hypothetical protein